MIQIIDEIKKPSFGENFSRAIGGAIQGTSQFMQENREKEALSNILGKESANLPRDFQKMQFANQLEIQKKADELRGQFEQDEQNYKTLQDAFGNKFANVWKSSPTGARTELLKGALDAKARGYDIDEMLTGISEPQTNDNEFNVTGNKNIIPESPKKPKGITPKEWEKQKSTQLYDVNKPILKEAGELRKNIPLQEQAIEDLMEAAPDVGIRDWMADYFEFEPLRSESGAKFKTGVKDFFLSDVSRVGARPNQWIEQQLMAALPVAGRSPTSNLITTAGLNFKKDLSKKRLELLDELTDKYGYSGIDLDKVVNKMMKSYVEERQNFLKEEIKSIKNRESKLSGKTIEVIGPDGEEYEVDQSEVELLPEGYLIK